MRRHVLPAALVIATAASCGGDRTPTAATPQAAISPTPRPTPTPVPLGQGLACGLPAMPECGQIDGPPAGNPPGVWGCCTYDRKNGNTYPGLVYDAMAKLQAEHPELFDGVKVLDRVRYIQGVATILERDYHVCAKPGYPGDEVGVKTSNSESEQYDIYTADGKIEYPSYKVTCTPARF